MAKTLWIYSYCCDGKFCHLQELKILILYTLQLWQILWNNFVNWILWKSEREPDEHSKNSQRTWQENENRQRKRFWQCVYAALSLTCVSVFIAILLFLFFIFHNLDNKPWTSIFPNLFYENNWRKEEKTLQYFDLSSDIFLMNLNELFEFWNKLDSAETKRQPDGRGEKLKTDNKKGFSNVFTLP